MSYKYQEGDLAKMSKQEMLEAVKARQIAPRWVVGTGYKDARKVAINWLTEMIEGENK